MEIISFKYRIVEQRKWLSSFLGPNPSFRKMTSLPTACQQLRLKWFPVAYYTSLKAAFLQSIFTALQEEDAYFSNTLECFYQGAEENSAIAKSHWFTWLFATEEQS